MTSNEIRIALTKRFYKPEWLLFREVTNTISFHNEERARYADFIAISLSKALGKTPLSIVGIEVKVSRADYKNELKDPDKSSMKKYCDEWYLACPKDLIHESELPDESWGLIYVRDDLTTVRKRLSKKSPAVLSKDFMASIFRRYAVEFISSNFGVHPINIVLEEYRSLLQIKQNSLPLCTTEPTEGKESNE